MDQNQTNRENLCFADDVSMTGRRQSNRKKEELQTPKMFAFIDTSRKVSTKTTQMMTLSEGSSNKILIRKKINHTPNYFKIK